MILNQFTETCIRCICAKLNLPENYSKLAIRSLVGNHVLCEVNGGNPIDAQGNIDHFLPHSKFQLSAPQRDAQPMGKVLSFVILCILNFTVCRLAKEIDENKPIPIDRFHGLINGDDVFFSLKNWKLWEACSGIVGLKNSVGKTFLSKAGTRCFIEMNSRTVIVDSLNPRRLEFHMVPFINFGLVKGLIRSENKKEVRILDEMANTISKMSSCHNELVTGFDIIYDDLDYLFKGYHKKFLDHELLNGIPYYIPKWLGGLGLNPGPNYQQKISDTHRRAASVIFSQFDDIKKRPKSIADPKVCYIDDIITRSVRKELELCHAPLEVPFQSIEDQSGNLKNLKEENLIVYNKLVEQVWKSEWASEFFAIRKKKKDATTFQEKSKLEMIRKMHFNQKLWISAHAVALNTFVKPLPYHKLWHQKFERYWPLFYETGDQINRSDILIKTNKLAAFKAHTQSIVWSLPLEILEYICHLLRQVQFIWRPFGNSGPLVQMEPHHKVCIQSDFFGFSSTMARRDHFITDVQYKNPVLNGSLALYKC